MLTSLFKSKPLLCDSEKIWLEQTVAFCLAHFDSDYFVHLAEDVNQHIQAKIQEWRPKYPGLSSSPMSMTVEVGSCGTTPTTPSQMSARTLGTGTTRSVAAPAGRPSTEPATTQTDGSR